MTNDPVPDDKFVRPFADWLREQSGGKTHDELSESLHDLIGRVRDTGKKGTLTLVITVGTMKGDLDVLVVSDEIKLRPPEHDRKPALYYPDKNGNLTRNDPNQLQFEGLREVPGMGSVDIATGELREIKA